MPDLAMTGSEAAPAKVNLYLHVVGRRPDGYHLLDSLAVFPGAADRLSATPAAAFSLVFEGPFGPKLAAEPDNLVARAAHALGALTGRAPSFRFVLDKQLPLASGIGGGSADAAATLRLLCRLWGTHPEPEALRVLAARLGADVPVCLAMAPQRMRHVGDILTPGPRLPPHAMVLVNPGLAVPTGEVFSARSGAFSDEAQLPDGWTDVTAMARDLVAFRNDLEAPAIRLCPVIGEILAALRAEPSCLLARMSGSGATCFGLFADPAAAAAAARRLRRPGWWCWSNRP